MFATAPSKADCTSWLRPFETFEAAYHDTQGLKTVKYHPLDFVFMVNGNHFVARWHHRNTPGVLLAYDNRQDKNPSRVRQIKNMDWWDAIISRRPKMLAAFYRIVEDLNYHDWSGDTGY